MTRKQWSGNAVPTTVDAMNNSQLTATLASSTGWPDGSVGPFVAVIDKGDEALEEKILVTSRSGTTLTITSRGYDGTTGVSHGADAPIEHCLDADTLDDLQDHVYDTTRDDHTQYQKESEKGVANGYASLDSSGDVPDAQIPSTIARDTEITTAVSNHEAASDPHTGYQLESGLTEAVEDIVGALLAADGAVTLNYDDGTGILTVGSDPSVLAGSGLGSSGDALVVNVDDATLEIATDTLQIKEVSNDEIVSGFLLAAKGTSHPSTPVAGQLDYDTTNNLLYVYNGTDWVQITPETANVDTDQTTTSIFATDLSTTGPAVTVNTGTKALVIFSATAYNTDEFSGCHFGFAVSGATTRALDTDEIATVSGANFNGQWQTASRQVLVTGLTAGANTFTMKYYVDGDTGHWRFRTITVVGIP